MRKRDKEVLQHLLREEDGTLKSLEKAYRQALDEIDERIQILRADEMTQSKIYQLKYQRALRSQVERIVDKLQGNAYKTVDDYLHSSYRDGFVGTMYALHGQKLPILAPIDKSAVEKAVRVDSQLSESLYETMRVDMRKLKRAIRTEISVGISTGKTFDEMASAIQRATNVPLNRTKTIVRTEGHRIQQASAADARNEAKRQGCDVLKQWDSTLDGNTRASHRALDGQIRETNEPFEVDGKQADRPGEFGRPEEDCNCRCVALTRARWGLGKDELKTLQERAEFFSLDKEDNFLEFRGKYLRAGESIEKSERKAYNSIAEMLQKSSDAREGFKFISDERFNQLTIAARKQGAVIVRGTPEVEAHLDLMGASASTMGDMLFFKKDVCVCEVLEETYHYMQNIHGMNNDKEEPLRSILNEIDAKRYIIQNAAKYNVPRNEVSLIERQLASYQRQLQKYMKGAD